MVSSRSNSPVEDLSSRSHVRRGSHSKDTSDIQTFNPHTIPLKSCIFISKGDGTDDRISVKKSKSVQFADTLGKPLKSVKTLAGSPEDFMFHQMHILALRSTTRRSFPVARTGMFNDDNNNKPSPPAPTVKGECVNFTNPVDTDHLVSRVEEDRVCLEKITFLDRSEDSIFGSVVVKNLCYEKSVQIHYTLDGWKNIHVESAKYETTSTDVRNADVFSFHIGPKKTSGGCAVDAGGNVGAGAGTGDVDGGAGSLDVMFAVCYTAKGCSYWDSNGGQNYHVKIVQLDGEKSQHEVGRNQMGDRKGFLLPLQCFGSAM